MLVCIVTCRVIAGIHTMDRFPFAFLSFEKLLYEHLDMSPIKATKAYLFPDRKDNELPEFPSLFSSSPQELRLYLLGCKME